MVKESIAKFLFWLSIVAILLISLKPGASSQLFLSLDKIAHFISFFWVTSLLLFAYKLTRPYFTSILILAAFGIGIEVIQYYIPGRVFNLFDFVADLLGIVAGIILYKLLSVVQSPAKL